MIKDCFERQRKLKAQGSGHVFEMVDIAEAEHTGNTAQKGEYEEENLETACACLLNESWGHGCCTHGDKLRLECGYELPLISALCRNKGKLRSMPVVSGVLNGKDVSVLKDSGCSTVVVRRDLILGNQMTGKVQRSILIDVTVRDAPVARVWMSSPYYTG